MFGTAPGALVVLHVSFVLIFNPAIKAVMAQDNMDTKCAECDGASYCRSINKARYATEIKCDLAGVIESTGRNLTDIFKKCHFSLPEVTGERRYWIKAKPGERCNMTFIKSYYSNSYIIDVLPGCQSGSYPYICKGVILPSSPGFRHLTSDREDQHQYYVSATKHTYAECENMCETYLQTLGSSLTEWIHLFIPPKVGDQLNKALNYWLTWYKSNGQCGMIGVSGSMFYSPYFTHYCHFKYYCVCSKLTATATTQTNFTTTSPNLDKKVFATITPSHTLSSKVNLPDLQSNLNSITSTATASSTNKPGTIPDYAAHTNLALALHGAKTTTSQGFRHLTSDRGDQHQYYVSATRHTYAVCENMCQTYLQTLGSSLTEWLHFQITQSVRNQLNKTLNYWLTWYKSNGQCGMIGVTGPKFYAPYFEQNCTFEYQCVCSQMTTTTTTQSTLTTTSSPNPDAKSSTTFSPKASLFDFHSNLASTTSTATASSTNKPGTVPDSTVHTNSALTLHGAKTTTSLGWTQIDDGLYRLTDKECTLSKTRQRCTLDNGQLSTAQGLYIAMLVLTLQLAPSVPINIWVHGTENRCRFTQVADMGCVLLIDKSSHTFKLETSSNTHRGLCEKIVSTTSTYSSTPASTQPSNMASTESPATTNTQSSTTTNTQSSTTASTRPSTMTSTESPTTTNTQSATTTTKQSSTTDIITNVTSGPTIAATTEQKSTFSTRQGTTTVRGMNSTNWFKEKQREYYVNRNQSSFSDASDTCRSQLNASMVFFTNALQYLDLVDKLHLTGGTFWVGVTINSSSPECLQLKVQPDATATLTKLNCQRELYSICSRSANITDVLSDPLFVRLIADMTVDKTMTQRSRRQRVSVFEERKTATAVGSIGVGFIITVFTIIALMDLSKLKCPCCRSKTTKLKVIHVKDPANRDRTVSDSSC